MRKLIPKVLTVLTVLGLLAGMSATAQYEQELTSIKQEWTRILLEVPEPLQAEAYRQLADRASSLAGRHPAREEAQRWEEVVWRAYVTRAHDHRYARNLG